MSSLQCFVRGIAVVWYELDYGWLYVLEHVVDVRGIPRREAISVEKHPFMNLKVHSFSGRSFRKVPVFVYCLRREHAVFVFIFTRRIFPTNSQPHVKAGWFCECQTEWCPTSEIGMRTDHLSFLTNGTVCGNVVLPILAFVPGPPYHFLQKVNENIQCKQSRVG